MALNGSLQRIFSVARKEAVHIRRDPVTFFFALALPMLQMFMLGFAIDTNVRHIQTLVLDECRTQETAQLLESFINSEDFDIIGYVQNEAQLQEAIVAGRAKIGIHIPEDYSRRLDMKQTAQVLILVDGSESSVTGEAVNVANAIALRESLKRVLGEQQLPIDSRPRVLFNPDTRSPNFFIPGLMVVLSQMMATMLTANAVVREKENGTLEQLYMTPVRAREVMVGKMLPYLALALIEFTFIAVFMRIVFQVPIHGRFFTLLMIAVPFALSCLAVGLVISTRASTRDAASQMVFGTVMPSIFLSGYIFPTASMPWIFRQISWVIPTTWMVDASRGVILRAAGWTELWPHFSVLWGIALTFLIVATLRFRKKLT
jgi:ABC-2 type transport system permease protein